MDLEKALKWWQEKSDHTRTLGEVAAFNDGWRWCLKAYVLDKCEEPAPEPQPRHVPHPVKYCFTIRQDGTLEVERAPVEVKADA